MKKFCFCLFLFLSASLARSAEVAVWGWHPDAWQAFFKKEFDLPVTILKPGENGRIPVEKFAPHSLVILDEGAPGVAATDAEIKTLAAYVSGGGHVMLFSGTVSGWLQGKTVFDLSRAAAILGASVYFHESFEIQVLVPDNPIVAHLAKKPAAWFKAAPGLSNLCGGTAVVGALSGEDAAARVLVNPFGKGCVFYIAPVAINSYRAGWELDEEAAGLVRLLKTVSGACLRNDPPMARVAPAGLARKTVCISVGGQRRPVVLRAEPPCQPIAKIFAQHLNQMTGSKVRVNDSVVPDGALMVYVGPHADLGPFNLDFTNLHPYGYHLRLLNPNTLVLAGKMPDTTAYAVYDFLKRYAGYRYFMPGPLGEILPTQEAVAIPAELSFKEEPSFISFNNAALYGGSGGFSRSGRLTLLATHFLATIYPSKKYGAQHPEYYPMIGGQRFVPPSDLGHTWQPCVSNPDLPAIAVAYAKNEWFPHQPNALGFSIGVNDGRGDCHCPQCTAWQEQYANPYIPFCNAVARLAQKELPGKKVGFDAYGGAAPPPRNLRLEPNLFVEVTSGLARDFEPLRAWRQAGAHNIGLYDYVYGFGYVAPRHYPRRIGNAWKKAYREYNLRSAWVESFVNVWLFDGPRQYVLNELAWNIDADIEGLLRDYFEKFYGEAAAPMRRFFDRIEAVYGRKLDPLNPMGDWNSTLQFDEYRRDDLSYLAAQLGEARRLARTPAVTGRLALFDKIFGLSRLYLEGYLTAKELENLSRQSKVNPTRAAALAAAGMAAVTGVETYTMTPAEQQAIFSETTLDAYRNIATLKVGPLVERGADAVFAQITTERKAAQGWPATRSLWMELAAAPGNELIRPLLLTQVFAADSPEAEINLLKNGGFETPAAANAEAGPAPERKCVEWHEVAGKFPGWSTWVFQQSVTRFFWDPAEGHTGQSSFSIRENQVDGCLMTALAVKPGCRFRLVFWVKQSPADKGGNLFIRWQNAKGWADEGSPAAPRILVYYPRENQSAWRRVETTFTVPANATACLPLFSAPRQSAADRIWFDDISLVKVYDPDYFKP
ncbi:MAG: DUF4838 domain-containing protein [Verrucomicrobia bacterium]|nr:DUF4838 domain-containing protein [Verrucomicrobiota bacterium]